MYVNKCIKCGREFETKNPKRVICPECLYPDKKMMLNAPSPQPSEGENASASTNLQEQPVRSYSTENNPQFYNSYSSGGRENQQNYNRPQRQYNNQGGYNRDNRQGGYNRNNYNSRYNNQGGYNRDNRQGGYNRNNYNRQGGYNNRPQRRPQNNRFNNRRPNNRNAAPKQLLVSREQLEQIELLYKLMLPLPNPDAHEVIAEKIGLEPRKVFFGINLIRQKMMLPKLPFPKRKLAITPDQLNAIKMLYEPLLPLPPIGCHKIIAAQLKMDEWRVHVGIGLVRSQMGLERWNQEREDAPEEFKKEHQAKLEAQKAEQASEKAKAEDAKPAEEPANTTTEADAEPPKKKRGRKPKSETVAEE